MTHRNGQPGRGRTALVLSGGGSRGAYQAGAWSGLNAAGYVPDLIVGTSIGAINGAFIAAGCTPAEMRALWGKLGTGNFAPLRRDYWRFRRWDSLARADNLERFLRDNLDVRRLRASPIQLRVIAVGTCCGEYAVFGNQDLTIEHLLASAAVPGVFPPVQIGDHYFVDGAVVHRTPFRPAIQDGADEIFAILNDPVSHCSMGHPGSVAQLMVRTLDISAHHTLQQELARAEQVNALLRSGVRRRGWRPLRLHVIAPEHAESGNAFHVNAAQTRRLLAAGFRDGQRFARQRWPIRASSARRAAATRRPGRPTPRSLSRTAPGLV